MALTIFINKRAKQNIARRGEKLRKMTFGMVFMLLIVGIIMFASGIRLVEPDYTDYVYIKSDGSIDPPSAPISTVDNITYVLTANISDKGIVIERDGIILDGEGHTVENLETTPPPWSGIYMDNKHNITIRNVVIKGFHWGIYLVNCSYNCIRDCHLNDNQKGVCLFSSHHNVVFKNNIRNSLKGFYLDESHDNSLYYNNVTDNFEQVFIVGEGYINTWHKEYPFGGNYWDDYPEGDSYSGRFQNLTGSDGIGDVPYSIDQYNVDRYPLMAPCSNVQIYVNWTLISPELYISSSEPREQEQVCIRARVILNNSLPKNVVLSYKVNDKNPWNTTMVYSETDGLWIVTIPGQPGNVTVRFKIYIYDHVGGLISSSLFAFDVKDLPIGDLNGDCYVGIDDIVTAAGHFGEECP